MPLPSQLATNPQLRERFNREAHVIAERLFERRGRPNPHWGRESGWPSIPRGQGARIPQINVVNNWFEELKARVPTK